MAVTLCEGVPESGKLWRLFLSTGWNSEYALSAADLRSAFEASWLVVAAYDRERLVGVGRVVCDGVVHAMIYDLIVSPDHQGRGIGGMLLERLVGHCTRERIRDIQLFCARGKQGFYEKRGFMARPAGAPGMEYRRQVPAA